MSTQNRAPIILVHNALPALDLSPSERFVFAAVASYADPDGSNAWPSQFTIATHTGYSTRQVRRAIAALVGRGLLIPDGKRVHPGTRAWTHRFRVNLAALSPQGPDIVSDPQLQGPDIVSDPQLQGPDIVSDPHPQGPDIVSDPQLQGPDMVSVRTGHHVLQPSPDHPLFFSKREKTELRSSIKKHTGMQIGDAALADLARILDPPITASEYNSALIDARQNWNEGFANRSGPKAIVKHAATLRARESTAAQIAEPIDPATCKHPDPADLGDVLRCRLCNHEWKGTQ